MSAGAELTPRQRLARLLACAGVATAVLLVPRPVDVQPEGWRLLAIFAAVLAGFVLRPLAMGPLVVFALVAAALTSSFTVDGKSKDEFAAAVSGYGDSVVWLVVGAFLLASAVRETGLGRRIALMLVVRLGRSTLGLGYAQCAAELVLGPLVPSNTARGGGILAPICRSLASAMGSEPDRGPERAGAYLSLVGSHANLVTAAMFLTGMAANPLVADAAREAYGVELDWGTWALGAVIPGLAALALLPPVLLALARPTVRDGRPAQDEARARLREMGAPSRGERVMLGVFAGMLALWATSRFTGLDAALVAWLGVAVLLATGARRWDEISGDAAAWDALIWLGGLLTLATGLAKLGVVAWFAGEMQALASGLGMLPTVLLLALAYFYSMYAFSMLTAHIAAMAGPFLAVCAGAKVPAMLAVPLIAYFSNLCACTTIYSSGPVIVYFGLGYVDAARWFRVGFLVSLLHLAVWIPLGLGWWKLLGWW